MPDDVPPGGLVIGRWPPGPSLFGLLAIVALTACDIPTDSPLLESRWILPGEETRFGVAELLPGDVTVTADSSAFVVDFDPVGFSETLGSLCTICVNGTTVPKPPFVGDVTSGIDFPPEVHSIEVLSGVVVLEVENGLNFDPLQGASGVTGSVTLTITDGADDDVLATLVIDGADTSFGPGSTLTRNVVLLPADVNGSLTATASVNSPLGDPVTIDTSLSLSVTATPMDILVGDVEIEVAGRAVSFDTVSVDVEDVDQEVRDRITDGAIILDVTNPFGIGADFQLEVSQREGSPVTFTPIQKASAIGPGATSTVTLPFSETELQSFLGQPDVVLTGGATVDADAGSVTVSPGQELVLTAKLDLTLLIGN